MGHIRVEGLGKAYKRYPHKWGRLAEWIGFGPRHEPNWVLRDVTFDIAPGEAVGIVGANGAGKSTLLKIIAGTVRPTTGSVQASGRIAALLELGIGFDPEFTGRENVLHEDQLFWGYLTTPAEQEAALARMQARRVRYVLVSSYAMGPHAFGVNYMERLGAFLRERCTLVANFAEPGYAVRVYATPFAEGM